MPTINYSYEVVSVDTENRVMEIIYSSDEYGNHRVGARMPFEDESIDDIIEMYSPVAEWLEKSRPVTPVNKGRKGNKQFRTGPPGLDSENQAAVLVSIVDTLQPVDQSSVRVIEELPIKNLRLTRIYNSDTVLVGLELLATEQSSPSAGANTLNNASTVIETAKNLGVTILVQSQSNNVNNFLTNIHGFIRVNTSGPYRIFYTPMTDRVGKKLISSSLEYMNRFIPEERLRVVRASMTDPEVKQFYDTLLTVNYVDINNPMIPLGLDLLIARGLINPNRRDDLLNPV